MREMMARIGWPDLVAPAFFLFCWTGYVAVADGRLGGPGSLMSRMHQYREVWMRRMLARDNRIADLPDRVGADAEQRLLRVQLVLVVGGCLAVLGAREQAMAVLGEIPLVPETPPLLWEMKVLLLVVVFVYAFFKFTWSLRQFNYVAIMIGAAPRTRRRRRDSLRYATAAAVASRAAEHFNKAMRTTISGSPAELVPPALPLHRGDRDGGPGRPIGASSTRTR